MTWEKVREFKRPDGAVVRLERTPMAYSAAAAGRWRVSVRAGGAVQGEPLVVGQGRGQPMTVDRARQLVESFCSRCIEPLALSGRAREAIDAALAGALSTPSQRADVDRELAAGRPERIAHTLELLVSHQRDTGAAAGLRDVAGQVRAEARAAVANLPAEARAPLPVPGGEVRRGR